jgi:hypothetical protein
MPRRLVVTSVVVAFALCAAHRAHAQSTWSDHARVSLNAGFQQPSTTFAATAHPPAYEGTATLTTNYTVPKGPLFDGGVILRLSGGFGIDIGVSSFSRNEVAPIVGSIPHPVLGNPPRPITGTSGSLEHSEIVGRLDAAYVVSAGLVDLALSAGPSFFTVNQDLVTNVTFAESPSFDRVTFTGATVASAGATKLGFNAGVDVGVKLSRNIGVGAMARYSHASMVFPLANTPAGVTADAGGVHIGGGVRVYF